MRSSALSKEARRDTTWTRTTCFTASCAPRSSRVARTSAFESAACSESGMKAADRKDGGLRYYSGPLGGWPIHGAFWSPRQLCDHGTREHRGSHGGCFSSRELGSPNKAHGQNSTGRSYSATLHTTKETVGDSPTHHLNREPDWERKTRLPRRGSSGSLAKAFVVVTVQVLNSRPLP